LDLATIVGRHRTATPDQRQAWNDAFRAALGDATVSGMVVDLPPVVSGA